MTDKDAGKGRPANEPAAKRRRIAGAESTESRHTMREAELRRKAEDFALINSINNAVNRGKSLYEIFALLGEETERIFSCSGASVYLFGEEGKDLELQKMMLRPALVERVEKIIGMKIPDVKIPLKEGSLYSEVLQGLEPRLINDPKTIRSLMAECTGDKRLKKLIPIIYRVLETRSVITVPLVSDGEPLGLMDVSRRKPFTESDLKRLKRISAGVTLAVKRKIVENALQKSEERYRQLFKSLPSSAALVDAAGHVLDVNRAASRLMGYSAEEMAGRRLSDFFHPEDRQESKDLFDSLVKGERGGHTIEMRCVRKNGKVVWGRLSVLSTGSDSTYSQYAVVICEDITERKNAEAASRKSEKRYRYLAELAPDAIVTVDRKGVFNSVNTAVTELSGYSKDELVDKHFSKIRCLRAKDIPIYRKLLSSLLKGKALGPFEVEWHHKNGDTRWGEVHVGTLKESDRIVGYQAIVRDITDRKLAEQALKKTNAFLRNLIDSLQDGLSILDQKGVHVSANKEFCRQTGFSEDELIGIGPPHPYWPPEECRNMQEAFNKTLKGQFEDLELTFMRKNGDRYPVIVSPNWLKNERGEVANYFATVKDITKLKEVEEALKESKELFEKTFLSQRDAIFILDANITPAILDCNPAAAEIFGYTRREMRGRTTDFLHVDETALRKFREILYPAIGKRGFLHLHEFKMKRKDGKCFPTEHSVMPLEDKQGKRIGWVSVVRDISERKKAEEAVELALADLDQIFNSSPEGMVVIDANFNMLRINETCSTLTGVSRNEVAGKKCYELWYSTLCQTADCPVSRIAGGEERVEVEVEKEHINGTKALYSVTATRYTNPDGRLLGIIESFRNITELKRAEGELKNSRERLRNLAARLQTIREEERASVAREIHDELGQSMAVLKMDLSWLQKGLSADKKPLLEKIKNMSELVDKTGQIAKRISAELRPGLLDDLGLVAAIEWQGQEFQERTGLQCEIASDPEDIILDRDRSTAIFRIFQETMMNVARHANATRVDVSLTERAGVLELRVRDNGRGITEEQISDSQSFGLIGIKERVYFLDGEVEVRGVRDGGTTVTVRIPVPREGVSR